MIGNKLETITYISTLKDDAIIEVKQKQKKSIRSMGQNKYYWSVIVSIIGDFHGFTECETHLLIKQMFKLDTTTDLSTSEFKTMIDMIIDMWATNYSVKIPLPMDSGLEKSLMKDIY